MLEEKDMHVDVPVAVELHARQGVPYGCAPSGVIAEVARYPRAIPGISIRVRFRHSLPGVKPDFGHAWFRPDELARATGT